MAMYFDKLGKESKDMLGKGFDSDKKVFKFSAQGVEGLNFESTTTSAKSLSNESNFKLEDESGAMDVKYTYKTTGELSFESNYDMAKLGFVDGLKLTLSGNDACKLTGKAEYKHDSLLCLRANLVFSENEKNQKIEPASTVSLVLGQDEFCLGLDSQVFGQTKDSGVGLTKNIPNFNINYLSKKNLGICVASKGLEKGKDKLSLNFRGIYYTPDFTGAISVNVSPFGETAGLGAIDAGFETSIDSDTSLKVKLANVSDVVADKLATRSLNVGLKKSLRKGCDVSLYYGAPCNGTVLSSLDAHKIGFNLEVKA